MSLRSLDTRGSDVTSPALIENLEARRLMAATPQIIGIKIAKAQDVDGSAANSNRITIAFSGTIRLGNTAAFSSFGYANDLADSTKQVKARVNMTITQPASNYIQIITDRLIRKGSRLTIASGGLSDKTSTPLIYDASTAAKTITFTVGQNKPRYTLSNRMFRPSDLSYVDRDVYATAPVATTASTTPAANTIRANLVTFFNAKVSRGFMTSAQATAALATYDSTTTAGIVPNANLRAALVSLTGTAAEPAINSYIGKSNVTGKSYSVVGFSSISGSATVGETKISENGRLNLQINPDYSGEPFQVLSSILAHEALHQDAASNNPSGTLPSSQDEEIIANVVETTVYAQQLLADPSIAGNGSKLVVRSNTRLLALLNSGDSLFPYGGIFQAPALSNNGNVFVGGKTNPGSFNDNTPVKSFENWIRREYIFRGFSAGGTATNPVARAILGNIVGTKGNLTLFGTDTEKQLDNGNKLLTDAVYIRLAQALKLTF